MNKKQKILFRSSIVVNILLALILSWGIVSVNFSNDQIFYTEVQDNLVELEGLIGYEKEHNWSQSNLVTQKLGEVLKGIYAGVNNGNYTKSLSKHETDIFEKLLSRLRQYPQDKQYEFVKLTNEDKENFEALRLKLRKAGLGVNLTEDSGLDSFIEKVEFLGDQIEAPLNQ